MATNDERIARARAALATYPGDTGAEFEGAQDLITDLLHLIEHDAPREPAARGGPRDGYTDATDAHRMAWTNYEGERGDGDNIEQGERAIHENDSRAAAEDAIRDSVQHGGDQ